MFHEPVKPIKYDILKNYAKIRCKIKSPSACTKILKRNNNRNKWLWHNSYFKSNMKFSLLYTTNNIEPSNSFWFNTYSLPPGSTVFPCAQDEGSATAGQHCYVTINHHPPCGNIYCGVSQKKVDNVARRSVHSM